VEKRVTIRVNEETLAILDKAKVVWSEHSESRSAIIRAIVSDWWRNRDENGGKTARINEHTDKAVSQAKDEIIAEVRKVKGSNHV
jgi:Arc/MetJ-type ribon-helix-helix transcriptional regulator